MEHAISIRVRDFTAAAILDVARRVVSSSSSSSSAIIAAMSSSCTTVGATTATASPGTTTIVTIVVAGTSFLAALLVGARTGLGVKLVCFEALHQVGVGGVLEEVGAVEHGGVSAGHRFVERGFFVVFREGRAIARKEEGPGAEIVEAAAEDANRKVGRSLDGAKVGQEVGAMGRTMRDGEEATHDGIDVVALCLWKGGAAGNKPIMALGIEELRIESEEGGERDGGSVSVGEPHGMHQGVDVVKLLGE